MAKSDLTGLKNIGPKTAVWLQSIGIESRDDLIDLGAVEVYRRLKVRYPREVSFNALWGVQGAILGMAWNQLPDDMKKDLLAQLECSE